MKIALIILITTLAATASAAGKEDRKAKPKAEPPSFVDEAKAAMRDDVRDPDSAIFRSVAMREGPYLDTSFRAVCGEINAKNGLGGYAGFQRFVVFQIANYSLNTRLESDHRFPSAWTSYCLPKP
jgi:hypothetical protein